MDFAIMRAVHDKKLHLVCAADDEAAVPQPVRGLGPWQVLARADVARFKLRYRVLLVEQRFVVLYMEIGLLRRVLDR